MLRAELAAAVVALVEEDHFVAGVELGHQQADDGRHAGGKQQRRLAPFERRQLALDHFFARVAVAAVFFARLLLLDEIDHRLRVGKRVGRRAEDRLGHGVAELLPLFAGMHGHGRWPGARAGGHLAGRILVAHGNSQLPMERCAWDLPGKTKKPRPLLAAARLTLIQVESPGKVGGRWHFSREGCKRPQIPSSVLILIAPEGT